MKTERIPVLIDRELYEKYKLHAQTSGDKPASVASVVRYALNEWISVVGKTESSSTMEVLDHVLSGAVPFTTLRDATSSALNLHEMN
jgi:hypothetical protein